MTDLFYYNVRIPNLLDVLSGGRASSLVAWAEVHNVDIRHVLDVRDERVEPSEELKMVLARYTGLVRSRPSVTVADEQWLYDEQRRLLADLDAVQHELCRRAERNRSSRPQPTSAPITVISEYVDLYLEEIDPAPDAEAA